MLPSSSKQSKQCSLIAPKSQIPESERDEAIFETLGKFRNLEVQYFYDFLIHIRLSPLKRKQGDECSS